MKNVNNYYIQDEIQLSAKSLNNLRKSTDTSLYFLSKSYGFQSYFAITMICPFLSFENLFDN